MTKRIKNFKIFIKTLLCVLVLGVGSLITSHYLNKNQELKQYSKNKDSFNYNVCANYSLINTERVLAGEQIYLQDEEYQLYKQTTYLSFLKKISRIAFEDIDIQESDSFYEVKYSKDTLINNVSSTYKNIKNKHISNYLNEITYNNKYLIVNNTYLLNEKEDYEYIKEVIYFVNPKTYLVEKGVEIDFKYNHINDDLQYSKSHSIKNDIINSINTVLEDSINVYKDLNSKKNIVVKQIEAEYGFKVSKMYVLNRNTVTVNSFDNKENIQYVYEK